MIPMVKKSKSEDVTQLPQHAIPVSNFNDAIEKVDQNREKLHNFQVEGVS